MKGLDLVFYVSVCTDTTKPIVGTIGFTLKTVFSLPVKQALLLLFFDLCSVEVNFWRGVRRIRRIEIVAKLFCCW